MVVLSAGVAVADSITGTQDRDVLDGSGKNETISGLEALTRSTAPGAGTQSRAATAATKRAAGVGPTRCMVGRATTT